MGEGSEMVFRDQSHNSGVIAPTQMPATFAIWLLGSAYISSTCLEKQNDFLILSFDFLLTQ